MNVRRIDFASLATAVMVVLVVAVGAGTAGYAVLDVVIGVLLGVAIGSPIAAGALTLVVVAVVSSFLGGALVLAAGASLVAAMSAIVARRRPTVGAVVRRLTAGSESVSLPGLSVLALVVAPLAAAGSIWLVPPPGEILGLNGVPRHVVTGLAVIGLVLLDGAFVSWRARALGTDPIHAALWGMLSAAMVIVWAAAIFIAVYVLSPPAGG